MLTHSKRQSIQSSIEALTCGLDDLACDFYEELFRRAPAVREMFPANMQDQIHKLKQTLAFVISNMEDDATLLPVLDELGVAHLSLGATVDQYGLVGEALLAALARNVRNWDAAQESAWSDLYVAVSGRMLDAAAQSGLPQ